MIYYVIAVIYLFIDHKRNNKRKRKVRKIERKNQNKILKFKNTMTL